ncbi:MAG: serine hydrolase [Spirulina sp.]
MTSKLGLGLALGLSLKLGQPLPAAIAPLSPLPAAAMTSVADSSPLAVNPLVAEMEAFLQAHTDHRQFMGSVMVVRDGETLLNLGYGMADLSQEVPNTPQTRFRMGSLTKQFTAAAILQLQERGMLDVQAPVKTYLPDYPNDTITLHHLLTHTAGLPNLTSTPEYFDWMQRPATLGELIARFRDLPLEFEPGSQHRYSNSGYILLTQVLETVSGQSYGDYIQDNLLTPLGLDNTGYEPSAVPGLAQGYRGTMRDYQTVPVANPTAAQGAGGLYSTVGDLVRWNQALFRGSPEDRAVLSEATVAAMTAPQASLGIPGLPHLAYGYGLGIDTSASPRIAHGGGISGFVSSLLYLPNQDATIVVLSNVESINPEQISAGLASILLGEPYDLPQALDAVTVDGAILACYLGTYQFSSVFQITITVEDGQLYAQGTGQPAIALYPKSDTEFFALAPELEVIFTPCADGTVESLTLIQSGQSTVAPRIQ